MPRCVICEKDAGQRCGRCESTFYCDKDCQNRDWPLHQPLCEGFRGFATRDPRPEDEIDPVSGGKTTYKLGLLLPEQSEMPQFVCIQITESRDELCAGGSQDTSHEGIFATGRHVTHVWKKPLGPYNHNLEVVLYGDAASNGREAKVLMLGTTDESWCVADPEKWSFIPSVLVAPKDRKAITRHRIESLVTYCKRIEGIMGNPAVEECYADVREFHATIIEEYICKAKFQAYFQQMKENSAKDDQAWVEVECPCGIIENEDRNSSKERK
ncbi:hypothetical protein B0J14DRAFT_639267 [Halenospora varia]|nr:hypothetical protein B0J14DRAFT_639267 [Halenospora varia]